MKTSENYKAYQKMKALGTMPLNAWGGLEILDIEYGIDDYVIACFNFGERKQIRKHKVYTTPAGRLYIRKQGTRYYFDQIMRV